MALTEKERLLLEAAMKKGSSDKYSSMMDNSAFSPDNDNRKVAEAALNSVISQSEMGQLLRNATSTTAGAPIDPRAAVGRVQHPLNASKAFIRGVTGETMPFIQGALTSATANIGDTANTLMLGMPVSDKMDKDFVLARDIVKRDLEKAANEYPDIEAAATPVALMGAAGALAATAPASLPLLAARYTLPRLGAAALSSGAESMMARPSEEGKITNPIDMLDAQTAIETAIGTALGPLFIKPGAKAKPATKVKPADIAPPSLPPSLPNPHLGRDIADIETELRQVGSQRAKAIRSNDKDAVKAIDINRKLLLEAQLIKRPELATARENLAAKETAKDAVMTAEGHRAYMSDEEIEAAAVAREAAAAKKKKKGGGGEGEGGAGGDSGGGGPRDDGGGSSGLSSALKATEDKTIDPETQLPFTDELIKRKEITRETTKTPAIRRILREGEVENDDVELAATVLAEAVKQTKDENIFFPSLDEETMTLAPRQTEWANDEQKQAYFEAIRKRNAENAARKNKKNQKPKVTEKPTAEPSTETGPRPNESIEDYYKRLREEKKADAVLAMSVLTDEMLADNTPTPRTPSNDQRVALYAPGTRGPDTLSDTPVDDNTMQAGPREFIRRNLKKLPTAIGEYIKGPPTITYLDRQAAIDNLEEELNKLRRSARTADFDSENMRSTVAEREAALTKRAELQEKADSKQRELLRQKRLYPSIDSIREMIIQHKDATDAIDAERAKQIRFINQVDTILRSDFHNDTERMYAFETKAALEDQLAAYDNSDAVRRTRAAADAYNRQIDQYVEEHPDLKNLWPEGHPRARPEKGEIESVDVSDKALEEEAKKVIQKNIIEQNRQLNIFMDRLAQSLIDRHGSDLNRQLVSEAAAGAREVEMDITPVMLQQAIDNIHNRRYFAAQPDVPEARPSLTDRASVAWDRFTTNLRNRRNRRDEE